MITTDWNTKGFSVSRHLDIAETLAMALAMAPWEPYRDIEKLAETKASRAVLDVIALEITERLEKNCKATRREIWRGSIGDAARYHSDLEDETNDAVAIICLTNNALNPVQYPIDFMDKVTGECTRYTPKFGDILLINNLHPTVLHRGPITNGPTDDFIIGQVSIKWT